jgi:aminoglycoside phosphotransferase (APT) family kinase protein
MVEGRIPADKPLYMTEGWVVDAMDEERRALWCSSIAIIANLSRVDWRARGLEPYAWPDRNRLAIDQHLAMWEDLYDWGASLLPQERHPLVEEVRLWLRKDMPHDETQAFIWGDCRFGNFVYQDFKPVGLLDWELAVVGDPECDFSYFLLAHRHLELLGSGGDRMKPRLGGFLSDEESIDYYEQYRGRKMRHYDYYWMFNAFKIYAIRQRIAALSIKWKTLSVEDAMQLRKIPTLEEETASRLR